MHTNDLEQSLCWGVVSSTNIPLNLHNLDLKESNIIDLHKNNNQLLRAKIAESERNHHNMAVLPGGSNYDSMQSSQQFDSRGYFQVTRLQPNNQYARQDQMSL
ncbi:hypothetical protein JHK85_025565 [Glycine max]|nr:hypothetical protein JHK85_025565 [Glycine max]